MAHWVSIWGQAHTELRMFTPGFDSNTMLLTIPSQLRGSKVRLRFSNREGKKPYRIVQGSVRTGNGPELPLSFHQKASAEIAAGAEIYGDAVTADVHEGDLITVRLAFSGKVMSGNGIEVPVIKSSKKGNFVNAPQFDCLMRGKSEAYHETIRPIAAISSIEVETDDNAGALVCFGDSITQQSKLEDISELSAYEKAFAKACGFDSLTEEEVIMAKVYYYGLAAWVDDEVGRVLTFLENSGLMKNTIIVFNADHGALRGESHGLGKHIFRRESQAVPLIIFDPARSTWDHEAKEGRIVDNICSNIDIAVTILHCVGIDDVPQEFHGSDLLAGDYPEEIYATIGFGEVGNYAYPNRQLGVLSDELYWPRRSCIRTQHYRLDLNMRINGQYVTPDADFGDYTNPEDLFFVDTEVCPRENRNMASDPAYADIIRELKSKLLKHCANPVEVPAEMMIMPEGYRGNN